MKIVVLMKQVPDMERVKFDYEKRKVDRSSAGVEINPYDLNALEAGVTIGKKIGAEVIAITMGPDRGKDLIIDAIARGADRGILVSDRKFGGADTKATAMTLKGAIDSLDNVGLILCGEKTVDGDTGQVGSELAEYLNIGQISYVEELVEFDDKEITVKANIMDSIYQISGSYPLLMTVTKDLNNPRYASIKRKLDARKMDIPILQFEELSKYVSEEEVGSPGSPTKVVNIEIVAPLARESKIVKLKDGIDDFLEEVYQELKEERIIG